MKRRAVEGSAWVAGSQAVTMVLRLGGQLTLAWLLSPAAFGLMMLVNVLIKGLTMFSDVGIRTSIIQNDRGDEMTFVNTAWTIQIIRGLVLWGIATLLAWPYALVMDEPMLKWLVPAVGLTAVFGGCGSTLRFTLERHLAYARVALLDLGGKIVTTAIMIYWAWLAPSVWALVGGAVLGASFAAAVSHFLIPGRRNRIEWNRDDARQIMSFGTWILIATAMTFLATQADRMIFGILLDTNALGVLAIAISMATIPREMIGQFRRRVILPAFSRVKDRPRETIRLKLRRIRTPLLLLAALCLSVVVTFGDYVIRLLFDSRYIEAAWMLPILMLGLWPRLLFGTTPSLTAIGKPQYNAFGNILRLIIVGAGLPLGYLFAGMPGALVVIACADLPNYAVATAGLFRENLACFGQDMLATVVFITLLLALLAGRQWFDLGSPFTLTFAGSG